MRFFEAKTALTLGTAFAPLRTMHTSLTFALALLVLASACTGTLEDGASTRDSITNGDVTESVPAIGFLADANERAFCTGVLIAADIVLTARHCINGQLARFSLSDGRSAEVGTIVVSDRVDLAYLVLNQAFRDVRLGQVRRSSHRGNCDYVALGYGSGKKEAIGLCADAGLITSTTSSVLGTQYIRAYTETSRSVCFGDSGGPLRVANTMSIVGIASTLSTDDCGDARLKFFYTPLASNLDFVDAALARSSAR
jgi:secreted trypsin-like serine protease